MDAATAKNDGGRLSLEQWSALNDEIRALVRAGLPLERGLTSAGADLRGRLGGLTRALAGRMEQGATLVEALEAESAGLPPVYRAVVLAGARSGRLDSALEGLADSLRSQIEMRRVLTLALIYPLIVLVIAYALFMGFLLILFPQFMETFRLFQLPVSTGLIGLERFGRSAAWWWPVGPVLLAVFLLSWWWSGRARAYPAGGYALLRLVPWMRGLTRQSAASRFAEMTALLIEHEVPLPEAIALAGQSSGDRALARSAETVAEGLRHGEPRVVRQARGFPALLRWLVSYGSRQGRLAASLRHAAESYHRRALVRAELIRTFLPALLSVVIASAAVGLYAVALFGPMSLLLLRLAEPTY